MTQEQTQAHDHYMRLYEMSLSEHVSPAGRAWLKREMAEMESDMTAAGFTA